MRFKKGQTPWNKGKTGIYSADTIREMSEAKKGHIPWNKGKTDVYTKETLDKMINAKLGKPNKKLSEKKKGIFPKQLLRGPKNGIPWNKGRTDLPPSWNKGLTKETDSRVKNQSEKQKGVKKSKPCWSKGLTKETDERIKKRAEKNTGKVRTPEHCKNISIAKTGKSINLVHTDEYKQNMSKLKKGVPRPQYIRDILKEVRKNQIIPLKDTKPEKMMQVALALNGIKYKKHKLISNRKDFWHHVDLFIEPNICIEVDGNYWHNLPENIERDNVVNHYLNLMGYFVIRIWESDIKKNTQGCAEKIIGMIKEKTNPKMEHV